MPAIRPSTLFLAFVAFSIVLVVLALHHAARHRLLNAQLAAQQREMVRIFRLTDLCLFTDASYTRHPSQADLHTPFQDYPLSLEHFPSGSLVLPPPHLRSHDQE